MKEYTFTYAITGVIFPKDDIEGFSEDEIKEALEETYENADCGAAYDVDAEFDIDCEWVRANAYFDAIVEADNDEQAKALAEEMVNGANFGDIRNVDAELVNVDFEELIEVENVKKTAEEREM